jgi:hypothetical protein
VFIHPMAMTANNAVFLAHTREIRNVAANIKILSIKIRDGPLLAGIEKVKLLMLLPNPMMLVVRLPVTTIQFHISYLYPAIMFRDQVGRYPRGEGAITETTN